jgi:hypothetical protein
LETAISDVEVEYLDVDKPIQRKVPGHGDKTYPFGQVTKELRSRRRRRRRRRRCLRQLVVLLL